MRTRKLSKVNSILEQEATLPPGGDQATSNITETPTDGDATLVSDTEETGSTEEAPKEAPTTSISKELQESEAFKAKIIKNFQKGNPTIIYDGKLYSIKKTADGKCDVSELKVGLNVHFTMWSAIMGKKLWDVMVTPKGLSCRLATSGMESTTEPSLIGDGETVVSDLHEIFPLLGKNGEKTEMLRLAGDSYTGKVNSAKGGDEYKIWNLVLTQNKIPGRKITKTYKMDPTTVETACRTIWKAMDGWGTDEDAINGALKRIADSENAAGNWMAMLYGWDNNYFGRGSKGRYSDIPRDIVDFAGGMQKVAVGSSGFVAGVPILGLLTLGAAGTLTQAWKENVGFSKNTPMYGPADETDLLSSHRGLLMDICDEMEDASTSDQTTCGKLLVQLTQGLPQDDYAWRLEDSATGEILISTGDSLAASKKGKKYISTAKSFRKRYIDIIGDLLGDDDWEGGHEGTESSGGKKAKGSYWSGAQGLIPDAWEFWK